MNMQALRMEAAGPPANVARVTLRDAAGLARIDEFVRDHPEGQLFQRPAWLQAVARGCGQDGFYLIAEQRGRLAGLVPVTDMRSIMFGRALVSSGFGIGGGILGEPDVAAALSRELWRIACHEGVPSAELRGGTSPGDDWRAEEGAHANFARDLADTDEAELLAIPRKQRAEVRRGIGFALDVEVGRAPRDRATHYAIYAESVRNLGTPVFPRRLFDSMLDGFGEDAEIMTVCREGVALASVLSFRHRGAIMPYWGGGTADARTWRANDVLYWELMRHARRNGCTRFDFGRSKVGSGAYAFKKNWGFVPEPLTYWSRGEKREMSPNDARYERKIALWKKLPLPVANLLGPIISRGLG